ncbi:MAG: phage tail assembly protein [Sulfuritalea sp.]|jgi:hypothetical protein|nr:phage tail assembly protein [Sulfuritalea sp.]
MASIKLSKPIKAHGEEISEIELREPTGADVMELGYPYLLIIGEDDAQAMELRPKVVCRYVAKLGKIPPSSLNEVSPADFGQMTGVVMGFFGVEAETLKG